MAVAVQVQKKLPPTSLASGAAVALWFFPANGKELALPAAMSREDFNVEVLILFKTKFVF